MEFVERNIIFHGSHFVDFYLELSIQVQEKIEYVLRIIRQVEKVSGKLLSPVQGAENIFEIRIEVNSNIYRIFCCFDEGNTVVLFNGFQKKTQKIPVREIKKAVRLKREYFELKKTQEHEERRNKKR